MLINCDIGERGADHPVDRELMTVIHVANLACGGHAGDAASLAVFSALARERGVTVTAHLSYPDRAHFGRQRLDLPWPRLQDSLDCQLEQLPQAEWVKFHGALYNQSAIDPLLAEALAGWLAERGIGGVLAPPDSEMALRAAARGVRVWREAFAERRYERFAGGLRLVGRDRPGAVIDDLETAVAQGLGIARTGHVAVWTGDRPDGGAPLVADTLCVHSDSAIALPLARRLFSSLER